MMSCKTQKYQLEENSVLSLQEGFYNVIPSPIKHGKSSVKATINLNNFDKENITLIGFYFRNEFIKFKEVRNPYGIEGSVKLDDTKKDAQIPFDIKNNEVVLSYKQNNKNKFVKFVLNKKKDFLDNVPMERNN